MMYAAAALLAILAGSASAQVVAQVQLPGNKIPQFIDPLPQLAVVPGGTIETIVAGTGEITLNMLEFKANVMPSTFLPANGLPYAGTWVFGYRNGPTTAPVTPVDTNVGPVIVATRHQPTQIRYVNNLTANGIHWRDWVDQSLHWANPAGVPMETAPGVGNASRYLGPVPAVPHLHGGEVPAVIDGGPEAWFLSDEPPPAGYPITMTQGNAYYTKVGVPVAANEAIYRYPNTQEASPLWFHDHLLGATRLNATFAGLAGAYPVIDPALPLPAGLHPIGLSNADGTGVRYLVPLVIQDRMFDTNGELFFPNVGVNPQHPIWVPEFVGDTIIVNGKVWPFMSVDRQRYRFYMINGSNSRPYDMYLVDRVTGVKGPPMWVIANDGGYLDAPVLLDPNATGAQKKAGVGKSLLFMPGERYEIIVDFADPTWLAAEAAAYAALGVPAPATFNLLLRNTAPTVMGNPNARTDGRIMEFRVTANAPVDTSYNPASGIPLRPPMVRLANAATGALAAGVTATLTRELTLNEVPGAGGPLEALVNNSKWVGHRPDGSMINGAVMVNGVGITELPLEGTTEVWEVVNLTADAHPIHLHGVQFQILNRQAFDAAGYTLTYNAAFPGLAYIPGYGPPLAYGPSVASGQKYGGNPDVFPFLLGLATPPAAFEAGWKDTAIMPSGFVTRIAVRFAPQDVVAGGTGSFIFHPSGLATNGQPGYYVWHCHITDHEDNEMMRPSQFQPNVPDTSRTYIQGVDF